LSTWQDKRECVWWFKHPGKIAAALEDAQGLFVFSKLSSRALLPDDTALQAVRVNDKRGHPFLIAWQGWYPGRQNHPFVQGGAPSLRG
jgi:hypothetical protein